MPIDAAIHLGALAARQTRRTDILHQAILDFLGRLLKAGIQENTVCLVRGYELGYRRIYTHGDQCDAMWWVFREVDEAGETQYREVRGERYPQLCECLPEGDRDSVVYPQGDLRHEYRGPSRLELLELAETLCPASMKQGQNHD
jgi:hypothetical protein